MAALLRSARIPKFSPSGLLQLTGIKRNAAPLARLYSGFLGSIRTRVCSHIRSPAFENASSNLWPYTVACVRTYAVVTEKNNDISVAVQSKQAKELDWAVTKLDSSVRRTGRVTKTLLLRIFHDICRTGYPSGNQALLLLRSCGSLLAEVLPEERTKLAHQVWEKLQKLGVQYDVSHFNALLKVYLQNEFKFSPTDYLAKMETSGVQPNRVTYQRLIAAYCQNGDIEGASTILGFMKSKDLPITETVFNSLITGHACAGDIESAKNILTVMKGAGIEPGPDSYVSLLNAYADKGDIDSMKKTLEEAESVDCSLMDVDLMQVIFTLAKAGYQQHVPEMVERLKQDWGYIPDAMNLCLRLTTQGLEDTAFYILKTFPAPQSDNLSTYSIDCGSFFLKHCVNIDMSPEKLGLYCKELQDSHLHSAALSFTLSCALSSKKMGMSSELMKILKEQDFPLRPHYFWPLFIQHTKVNNTAGVLEVLKVMLELGVSPDVETLTSYVVPAFPDEKAVQQALKDVGVSLESEEFLSAKIRMMAVNNLTELYSLLSDPSFPSVYLGAFYRSLIQGFKKSDDVETMVKITELLYKDKRFSKGISKPTAYPEKATLFLYNLIESMSDKEVQMQVDKLQKYFRQLKTQNITISANIYRGIKNLLDSYQVPELIKSVFVLVDSRDELSSDPLLAVSRVSGTRESVEELEKKLAELKVENQPLGPILKELIRSLRTELNLQRALELKELHEEEMTVGSYCTLIDLCCRLNNVDEALNLKMELSRKDSTVLLDAGKYIALVRSLSTNGRVEEAVDILKEMKEKEVVMVDTNLTMLFRLFNGLAAKGDAPTIQQLQDNIFTLGLTKPTTSLCSSLISAHLNSNDLSGALDAVVECQNRYGILPRIHDIIVGLVEKGDTDLLQKAMDFLSQKRGEMSMLYILFFAFLQTGRNREARKIIETPGLRAKAGRLQWFAEKCVSTNQMETLEQLVNMTAKLFECDRDEMYSYILQLCNKTNDWQKAESVWTKMQEENIIPRERTLRMLADILINNGQKVPFEVSETWYKKDEPKQMVKYVPKKTADAYQIRLIAYCKSNKTADAYKMLNNAKQNGVILSPTTCNHVICSLLAEGSLEEAKAATDIATSHVSNFKLSDTATSLFIITHSKKGQTKDALQKLKSMLSANKLPSLISIIRLVQALGSQGDLEGIQVVKSMVKDIGMAHKLSNMFVNNSALAHIKNGDLESAVEMLEEVYSRPESSKPSMAFVFKKILEENNDKALDKLSAMAERLANHFACYRPTSDLFLQLLEMDKVEDAKFLLDRCNALAEQTEVLKAYVVKKSQFPGQVGKIKTLMSLIPNITEKIVLYPFLLKCHYLDNDISSAKTLYEQLQKEGIFIDELSLKRLAELYRKNGETVPFTEPPESFRFYAAKIKEGYDKTQAQAEE